MQDDSLDGTSDAIARRCRELDTLLRGLNRWAHLHDSKIPKRARMALAQYRTLLSGTLTALRHSLQLYEAELEAALKRLNAD
ncbi:MAG: hypothetical protein AB7O68_14560 [Pirellulales bacterium]